MKKTSEIVIIGGGIVGCSLAAALAEENGDITVIDKRGISEYASSSNFGMVWLQTRFPGYDTNMSGRSQEIYENHIESGDFRIDIEYEKLGGLTIAFTDLQLEVMKRQVREKQKFGTPMTILDKTDTLRLEPALSEEVAGSIFCGDDARVNPMLATMGFADIAKRRGVRFCEGAEVIGITKENGRVDSVVTNRGSISAKIVINAAGVWARDICKMADIDLPVFPQRLQGLVTEPVCPAIRRIVQVARDIEEGMDPEKATGFMFEYEGEPTEENLPQLPVEDTIFTYVQQTLSDTIAIGTTNEFVGKDIRTTPEALTAMLKNGCRAFPFVENMNIIRSWASLVPFTYDGMPVLGHVPGLDGFILATGHGHAMCHAPALAEQIRDFLAYGKELKAMDKVGYARFLT